MEEVEARLRQVFLSRGMPRRWREVICSHRCEQKARPKVGSSQSAREQCPLSQLPHNAPESGTRSPHPATQKGTRPSELLSWLLSSRLVLESEAEAVAASDDCDSSGSGRAVPF